MDLSILDEKKITPLVRREMILREKVDTIYLRPQLLDDLRWYMSEGLKYTEIQTGERVFLKAAYMTQQYATSFKRWQERRTKTTKLIVLGIYLRLCSLRTKAGKT